MENLLARIRRMGFLIVLGLCLIIYVGLGIIYVQQGPKQEDLEDQINKTLLIVNKPLPSMKELRAKHDEVNLALAPLEVPDTLKMIVSIAKESGIDVDPESGKFRIPAPSKPRTQKMGEGTYQILSFDRINAQGDYDDVMAFIADLDSGKTLETMVLKRVEVSQIEILFRDEEAERRAEFREVLTALAEMMVDNGITEIPNPINYDGGIASNDMIAFPDITTPAAQKGYTGTGSPNYGYTLAQHDKISADDTAEFETISYIPALNTVYYYTCEADGTVRQFDEADLDIANEYRGSEEIAIETIATLTIDFYTKPVAG